MAKARWSAPVRYVLDIAMLLTIVVIAAVIVAKFAPSGEGPTPNEVRGQACADAGLAPVYSFDASDNLTITGCSPGLALQPAE